MTYKPFDSCDPFDATAEKLRVMVCDIALSVMNTRAYRQLEPAKQVEAMLCGITAGMISVAFAQIAEEGRDEITAFIKGYIDQARLQVEGLVLGGETRQ